MSKAFTKDDAGDAALLVAPRAPLADGVPNYVTPRGFAALQMELSSFARQRTALELAELADRAAQLQALGQRMTELQGRIANAVVVDASPESRDLVRFGASVRVRHESGKEQQYQIVGVDEADIASGKVAFSAPLARALLGKRVGDSVELRAPRATEELELLSISYDDLDSP